MTMKISENIGLVITREKDTNQDKAIDQILELIQTREPDEPNQKVVYIGENDINLKNVVHYTKGELWDASPHKNKLMLATKHQPDWVILDNCSNLHDLIDLVNVQLAGHNIVVIINPELSKNKEDLLEALIRKIYYEHPGIDLQSAKQDVAKALNRFLHVTY